MPTLKPPLAVRFLNFDDLKRMGIVRNRTSLARWQRDRGFPDGIAVGLNSIVYSEAEVLAWIAAQPRRHTVYEVKGFKQVLPGRPSVPVPHPTRKPAKPVKTHAKRELADA